MSPGAQRSADMRAWRASPLGYPTDLPSGPPTGNLVPIDPRNEVFGGSDPPNVLVRRILAVRPKRLDIDVAVAAVVVSTYGVLRLRVAAPRFPVA